MKIIRTHKLAIFSCLLCLLAAGCASTNVYVGEPISLEIPVRDFLLRGQTAPPGLGAYGYILFTNRPTTSTLSRYTAVCKAYESYIESIEEFSDIDPSRLMVTFWLLRSETEGQDCTALIANYDFARSTEMARVIRKLGVAGPVLVAWREAFSGATTSSQEALVFDMSAFRDEEEIARAFQAWKDQLSHNPSVWENGFNLSFVREQLRAFLNTYGEQIVAIVSGE